MKKRLFYFIAFGTLGIVLQGGQCGVSTTIGCGCEGSASAGSTKIITNSNKTVSFSTYEYSGKNEADGACHTYMELTFRWASVERAKGNERPPINYQFQTLFSYFSTGQNMETIFVDPSGIRIYKIHINEAANKDNPTGLSYEIVASYYGQETPDNDVICAFYIDYKVYDQSAYLEECKES